MNFSPLDQEEAANDESKSSVLLKARSILVLSGKARQVILNQSGIFVVDLNIDLVLLRHRKWGLRDQSSPPKN
jgi:hypothetical protein